MLYVTGEKSLAGQPQALEFIVLEAIAKDKENARR